MCTDYITFRCQQCFLISSFSTSPSPLFRPSLSVVLPDNQKAEGSAQADPGAPSSSSSGPHKTKLPSFISLSSSPEDTDAPDTPPADGAEVTGERSYSDQES